MVRTNIILDYSATDVRIVLRVYFTVVLFLVSLIGNQCWKLRAKHLLLRDRRLEVLKLIGWLSLFETFNMMWLSRSRYLGWMVNAMILAGLLDKAADFAVTGLVVTDYVYTRCDFDTKGDFVVFAADPNAGGLSTPEYAGYTAQFASQVQHYSVLNGGIDAIYGKINRNAEFVAREEDIVGNWNCSDVGNDQSYATDYDPHDIATDLESKGLMYDENDSCWRSYTGPGGNFSNQITAWSVNSDANHTATPWKFMMSFDTTASSEETKVMKTYQCSLDAPSVQWVFNHVNFEETLPSWCDSLRGRMYVGLTKDKNFTASPQTIGSFLNTLTMSIGAVQSQNTSLIQDWTQGCLAKRTTIPWPISALFAVSALLFLAIIGAWITLTWLAHHASKDVPSPVLKATNHLIPIGFLSWIKHGVHQMTKSQNIRTRELKYWWFSIRENGEMCCSSDENEGSELEDRRQGAPLLRS